MKNLNVEHKVVLRAQTEPTQISSEYHDCAFNWCDKCAYCEMGYDDLKLSFLSSNDQSDENLIQLREKIEDCLFKLEGFFNLKNFINY